MYLTFFINKINREPVYQDYSLDDFFNGKPIAAPTISKYTRTNFTRKTVKTQKPPSHHDQHIVNNALRKIYEIVDRHNPETVSSEYTTFFIPKRTGGQREINAPTEELMKDLRDIRDIFQYDLSVLTHEAAHAYTEHRSTMTALQVHQKNHSRWFLKLDIKDFFPSCNEKFLTDMLEEVYPFATMSRAEIEAFIWIALKDNQLPQGTPLSPLLTNIVMTPIDYEIEQYCKKCKLIYTRYADDILISGHESFNWQVVQATIMQIFNKMNAPFNIKPEKTRYGSSAGRNWNLGLMLNKDNNITIGYRKKKRYKAALHNLMETYTNGSCYTKDELYHFQGITSYYLSIEPEYISNLISTYETKYNIYLKDLYKGL